MSNTSFFWEITVQILTQKTHFKDFFYEFHSRASQMVQSMWQTSYSLGHLTSYSASQPLPHKTLPGLVNQHRSHSKCPNKLVTLILNELYFSIKLFLEPIFGKTNKKIKKKSLILLWLANFVGLHPKMPKVA